ncbi:MAG: hypothetical protein ACTMIY_11865 [Microbacterium gubbeenense]
MSIDIPAPVTTDVLKDSHGAYTMLAIDQRESLRSMMSAGQNRDVVTDDELADFKTLAARTLTPHVSGVLLDRAYGRPAIAASESAVILAADVLFQEPGGPVTGSALDTSVTPDLVRELGADALKMLVPWLPDARREAIDLSARFMDLCRDAGVPGIVEGVVRPADISDWSDERRDEALVAAAADLATTKPDLYKAEIPSYGRGDLDAITATCRRITEMLDCEWVVLSSGVAADDFPAAVGACIRGGASGFLAGRAVWADSLKTNDVEGFLADESVRRLAALAETAHANLER